MCIFILALAAIVMPLRAADPSLAGLWKTIDDRTHKARGLMRLYELGGAIFGKIETSFEKPANTVAGKTVATDSTATSRTVEPKGAPPPITPISTSGTGSINVDPAKMSYKELRQYERERNRKR